MLWRWMVRRLWCKKEVSGGGGGVCWLGGDDDDGVVVTRLGAGQLGGLIGKKGMM